MSSLFWFLPKTIDWDVSSFFSTKFTKLVKHQTLKVTNYSGHMHWKPHLACLFVHWWTKRRWVPSVHYGFGQWLLLLQM
jgi:hypothetical protein